MTHGPGSTNVEAPKPLPSPGNDTPPSIEDLKSIENFIVLDNKGEQHPFKNLYGGPHTTRRVLVVFIRNFFCGGCMNYVKFLSQSASLKNLKAIDTSIVFIGNGDPSFIDGYVEETKCEHPIYTDPTVELFDALGMVKTMTIGTPKDYVPESEAKLVVEGLSRVFKKFVSGVAVTKAGVAKQQGAELLFEGEGDDKRVTWCHRMRDAKDHTDKDDILKVLGLSS